MHHLYMLENSLKILLCCLSVYKLLLKKTKTVWNYFHTVDMADYLLPLSYYSIKSIGFQYITEIYTANSIKKDGDNTYAMSVFSVAATENHCCLASGDHIRNKQKIRTLHQSVKSSDYSFLVGRGGFEPPKSSTADLQSAPFGHSGTYPY